MQWKFKGNECWHRHRGRDQDDDWIYGWFREDGSVYFELNWTAQYPTLEEAKRAADKQIEAAAG